MKIKAPTLEINEQEPFENDVLNRQESAEILTELIVSLDESSVLSINGSWGSGKTTFIRMWQAYLINNDYPTIYFNAWENDFADDATAALIAEIEIGIKSLEIKPEKRAVVNEKLGQTKRIGGYLLKRAVPTALKLATYGIVDLQGMSEQALGELTSKLAEDKIDQYEKSKNIVADFKESLSAAVANLDKTKPLIIFIDELDRCRPDFSITILEKVKHFFSIKNIIFVLAIDKIQLCHSVRALYGEGMDANGYLRRFIDFDYQLPINSYDNYIDYLFERFGFEEYFKNRTTREKRYEPQQIKETMSALCHSFNISLRTIEQCFSNMSIVLRTTPPNILLFPILLSALIVLKASNTSLYEGYITGKVNDDDIIEHIKQSPRGRSFLTSNYGYALEGFLELGLLDISGMSDIGKIYKQESQAIEDEKEIKKIEIKQNVLQELFRSGASKPVFMLADKINISERFIA